jgi:hypothetical protein
VLTPKRRKGTKSYLLISSTNKEIAFLAEDDEHAFWYALDIAKENSLTIKDIKPYA